MDRLRLLRHIHLGVRNLILHRGRSALTMLGMIFGVGSVIAMLSVGEGASRAAIEQIRLLGSRNIILSSVKPVEELGDTQGRVRMSLYGLTFEDEARIRETFPQVVRTVPVKQIRKEGRAGTRVLEVRIVGTTPDWFELVRRPLVAGRPIVPRDMEERGAVAVTTEQVARRLLAAQEAPGGVVRLGGDYFQVVGVVRGHEGGESDLKAPDEPADIYVPLCVARERFGDVSVRRSSGARIREKVELHQIIVEVESVERVEAVAAGIAEMLRRFHPRGDYHIGVPLALLRQAEETRRTFNIVLGSIAAISLLVGGIGIMNIMLATVTERTREIGIRRAIGARPRQIVGQFLVETVVLSTTGGVLGIAVGVTISRFITFFSGMETVVTPLSVLLSVGVSVAVGVIFGLYPALRAAGLDPVEALRHG